VPGLVPGIHVFLAFIRGGFKTWMPTDQVRGLTAHWTSPAKGLLVMNWRAADDDWARWAGLSGSSFLAR
jgi:hypothetical protein